MGIDATTARSHFAAIVAAQSGLTVEVVNGAATATGIRGTRRGAGELIEAGYTHGDSQSVWVNTASIGAVTNGQRITVAGETVEVSNVSPDPATALTRIDYTFKPAPTGKRP
jgi:hypothetical protein